MRYAARTALLALSVAVAPAAFAQGQPPPQATETVAAAIPGVIAAGTKIEVIKAVSPAPKGLVTRRQPHLHGNNGQSHHQDRQGQQIRPSKHQRLERSRLRRQGR